MRTVQAHGARIPMVGLGTWTLRGRDCVSLVEQAVADGYRHIDTAQMYGNEREVGEGVRASGKRDEVFVTTKITPEHLAPRDVDHSVKDSLAALKLDAVDLLLIHWPNPRVPLADTLGAMAKLKKTGATRHIGVSNFTVALIEEAMKVSPEPIVCNQIECHPYLDQSKVIAACQQARRRRDRLQPDRARPRRRRRVDGEDRQSARQERGAGMSALAGAAGHRRHSAHQQGRAAGREPGHLRLPNYRTPR